MDKDILGSAVSNEVSRNPDGCEVSLSLLEELGIPLDSRAYIEWLEIHRLRQLRPTKTKVCFVKVPELPEDLKRAVDEDKL